MLNIPATYGQMGKLANNLEKHGEEEVTAFDIPVEGITLRPEAVNQLLEDPYADRWLFNDKGGTREPSTRKFEPFRLRDTYEGATVSMKFGDDTFTFTECRIKDVELEPRTGGDTLLGFSVRVRPENDKQILQLLGHQNREVNIDITDARIAVKGGRKQQELPLTQAQEESDEPKHPDELFEARTRKGKGNGEARA